LEIAKIWAVVCAARDGDGIFNEYQTGAHTEGAASQIETAKEHLFPKYYTRYLCDHLILMDGRLLHSMPIGLNF